MLYQRYMIYRVRSNCHLSYSTRKKRQRARVALLALPLMALCATGIYGAFEVPSSEQTIAGTPSSSAGLPNLGSGFSEVATEARSQLAERAPQEDIADAIQGEPTLELASDASVEPEVGTIPSSTQATDSTEPAPGVASDEGAAQQQAEPATPAEVDKALVASTEPQPAPTESAQTEGATESATAESEGSPSGDQTDQSVADADASADSDEPNLVDEDNIGSRWVEVTVESGDNLPKIFERLKLPVTLLHQIVDSGKDGKELANLRPGETFRALLDSQHKMEELVYQRNVLSSIRVTVEEDQIKVRKSDKPTTTQKALITGTITSSLYESAKKAGLTERMILDMAQIFGWDIDFARDIQPGDHFTVIFDEEYVEGEKFRNGPILAAEFVNQGKSYRAYRFEEGDGHANYYNADGKGMRKAFLRAPLDVLRVTSRFQPERYHPVLGVKRPHRGVDYGAPTGTPVYAAGDGKIEFSGSKSGYGNTIIIQHGDGRSTLYGHLSRINSKAGTGNRIKQGQVIGYVGATGLATGPHLHYEFRINGVHQNPEKIKLPNMVALEKAQRDKFRKIVATYVAQLDKVAKTQVADASLGGTRIQ